MIPFRRNHEVYTTPLASDVDLQKRFSECVLRCIKMQRGKFPSVFRVYEDEDILSECWIRVLQSDANYNSEKGSLNAWTYRIVSNVLKDKLWECNNRKYDCRVSLESCCISNKDDSDKSITYDKILASDFCTESESALEMLFNDLKQINYVESDNIVSLCDVLYGVMSRDGFKKMSEHFGVDAVRLKNFYNFYLDVIEDKCYFYGIKE